MSPRLLTEPLQASVKNTFLHFDVFGENHASARRGRSHSEPPRSAYVRSFFNPSILRVAAVPEHDKSLKDIENVSITDNTSSQSTMDVLPEGNGCLTPSRRGSDSGDMSPRSSVMSGGVEQAGERYHQEDINFAVVSKADSRARSSSVVAPYGALDAEQEVNAVVEDTRTTVMLRNLPDHVTRDDLIELFDAEGFAASFDFVYLPVHFAYGHHFGYAFVNLVDAEQARMFWNHFTGFKMVSDDGTEMETHVNWSVLQGLDGNISHYRNSQLMHPEVSDRLRPVLFRNGLRAAFPPPTKPLRKPRLRSPKNAVQDAAGVNQ